MGDPGRDHTKGVSALGLEHSGFQLGDLLSGLVDFHSLAERRFELLGLPGFPQIAADVAAVDGGNGLGEIGECGDQNPHRIRVAILCYLEDLDPRHSWHSLVDQQHRDLLLGQ